MFRSLSRRIAMVVIFAVGVTVIGSRMYEQPRTLSTNEVPIVFWHWRTPAPDPHDISSAISKAKMRKLFIRSGQFDSRNSIVERIQPMVGSYPSAPVELHLAYNATPKLLREFEQIDPAKVALSVAGTYRSDLERANKDGANVVGLQLDFDVPTRLLSNYADLLRVLRAALPPDTNLSITGLPAWVLSNDLATVLQVVDFWIPQFYGSEIPLGVDRKIPISSAQDVARYVARVRQVGRPFYAGLSAYGYAVLYGKDGSLIEVRGDIDRQQAGRDSELELIEHSNFPNSDEDRIVYRARGDHVFRGLILRAGETIVFDIPTVASLKAAARAVRENAGEQLLGICIFRLPSGVDKTNLSIDEVSSALTSK
ncbi:MAG TPA: DUF3142 domain-containing protein [Pyrinomonadaceae bacterium]|jgi:Protein of unknown function (DUF3142)|nr:DUF3142 domain-containing protein [Pyrinomonadaceae bacterium]